MSKLIEKIVASKATIYPQLRLGSWICLWVFGAGGIIFQSLASIGWGATLFLFLQISALMVDGMEYSKDDK